MCTLLLSGHETEGLVFETDCIWGVDGVEGVWVCFLGRGFGLDLEVYGCRWWLRNGCKLGLYETGSVERCGDLRM